MTTPDPDTEDYSNPLTRSTPLGGRTGVAIASIVPIICVGLFLAFGFLGGWRWSWIFFLAVPIVFIVVYGRRIEAAVGSELSKRPPIRRDILI